MRWLLDITADVDHDSAGNINGKARRFCSCYRVIEKVSEKGGRGHELILPRGHLTIIPYPQQQQASFPTKPTSTDVTGSPGMLCLNLGFPSGRSLVNQGGGNNFACPDTAISYHRILRRIARPKPDAHTSPCTSSSRGGGPNTFRKRP